MSSLRQAARKALATLLTSGCDSAEVVYDHLRGSFDLSPAVVVSSNGSRRQRLTRAGKRTEIFLQIDSFVEYAIAGTWTEAQAEDTLDALDEEIAAVISANQVTASWAALDEVERSERFDVALGGKEYVHESRTVRAEVYA
jgi:hypothetical protein